MKNNKTIYACGSCGSKGKGTKGKGTKGWR